MTRAQTVVVTDDHIKLLRRLRFEFEVGGYQGAPVVNEKRPYGNSDVLGDIAEILDWTLVEDRDGDKLMTAEQGSAAMELHESMADVLQALVQNPLDFKVGRYVNVDPFAPYAVTLRHESSEVPA